MGTFLENVDLVFDVGGVVFRVSQVQNFGGKLLSRWFMNGFVNSAIRPRRLSNNVIVLTSLTMWSTKFQCVRLVVRW